MDKYSRVDLRLQEMGGINNGEMSINELAAFVNMLLGVDIRDTIYIYGYEAAEER